MRALQINLPGSSVLMPPGTDRWSHAMDNGQAVIPDT